MACIRRLFGHPRARTWLCGYTASVLNTPALLTGSLATIAAAAALSMLAWRRDTGPTPILRSSVTSRPWIVSHEIMVVAAIAPALLFPSPLRLTVLASVPLLWLGAARAGLSIVPKTPLTPLLWVLLALVAISTRVTFDVAFSLGKIAGAILGVLVYWSAVRWIDTPNRLRLALAAFVFAGAALALLGLFGIEKAGTTKSPVLNDIVAKLPTLIRGVPGAESGFSPNPVAGCLALFLPLQVALLMHSGLRQWMLTGLTRAAGRAALVFQILGLILTLGATVLMQSRGTWLGLLLAAGAWVIWVSRPVRRLTAVAAGVVLAGFLLAGPSRTWEAAASRFGPHISADLSVRVSLWTSGLRGIQDAPLTGYGLNTFRRIMMERYAIPEITSHYVEVAHAHNNLLQAALDLGLPGLTVYLSIWITAAWMIISVVRESAGSPLAAASASLGFGLLAHFTFGLADAIPLGAKVGVLFWISLALVAASYALGFRHRSLDIPEGPEAFDLLFRQGRGPQ